KKDPPYPTRDQLRAEAEEEGPAILVTVSDSTGRVVRTLTGPVGQGFHRVAWDLRDPAATLPRPRPTEADDDIFSEGSGDALVMPGSYRVSLAKRVDGVVTPLAGPQSFNVIVEGADRMELADFKTLSEFQQKVARLERAVAGALEAANDLDKRLAQI